MTVPGTQKVSISANSSRTLPLNCWRDSTHAASRPMVAVMGAAMAASLMVVKNEPQAPPVHKMPLGVHSSAKARPKWDSVGVQSRPHTFTKPPASAST